MVIKEVKQTQWENVRMKLGKKVMADMRVK